MAKTYTMFIDETGSSGGTGHFSVAGVIFETSYAYNEDKTIVPILKQKVDAFKDNCFGRHDFIFHLVELISGTFPPGTTQAQRIKFWNDLPSFLAGLPFHVFSVTVDKPMLNDYFSSPKDPYLVAFAHIMKSFFAFIDKPHIDSSRIILESRDDYHDLKIQKAFFEILNHGTVHLDIKEELKNKIKGFSFIEKDDPASYQTGLEIADLLCSPLHRVKTGCKKELNPKGFVYGTTPRIFNAIQNKIFVGKPGHDIINWGFKQVPVIESP